MKKFILVLVFACVIVPGFALAQTGGSTQAQLKTIAALKAQIVALQEQLKSQSQGVSSTVKAVAPTPLKIQLGEIQTSPVDQKEEWKFNYSKSDVKLGAGKEDEAAEDGETIRRYVVRNNRLYENKQWTKDTQTDEYKMWNVFAKIAGDDFVNDYITRYAAYRNSGTRVLGIVQVLDDKEPSWGLGVNATASNFSSEKWVRDLSAMLIHEYAHVLTLNGDQVNHNRKHEVACRGNYLSNKGCSEKKSYINEYVAKFWDEEEFSRKTPAKEKYFKEHQDEFVTQYGLTNPEEDIAESFTQFILYTKPTGTMEKDLKVAFFYNYPELVEMRERIREEVKEYFVK